MVPDRKCRVCTSWHSRHLPKSPLDGHLVAAAVNALYTPAPVYLCIPGRGPQTRVHVFSVSAAPILEAVPMCVSAEDVECLSVCSIDTPALSSLLGLCQPIGGKPCSFSLRVLLKVLLYLFPYVEKPLCPFL